jgi:ribonuclease P/MRP protein subunit RPP40
LQLINELTRSVDEGNVTVGVFIDLAKGFDTVDHGILLKKFHFYGIRGVPHQWFSSYLENRKQFVTINNTNSSLSNVTCGVPQGFILGPILFIIYVNGLNNVSNKLRNIMFADDTNLLMTEKNIEKVETQINFELKLLIEWFQVNLLSLNISKTNYIIFGKKRNINANILCGDTALVRLNETKFLGVILSSDLSWNKHVNIVANKISKNIGIIAKVRHLLPTYLTCMLYKTLVEPYINYCNLVWARQHKRENLEEILKIQERFCRIITFSTFHAYPQPLFKQLALMTVYDIFKYQFAMFMYKCVNSLLPQNRSFFFRYE